MVDGTRDALLGGPLTEILCERGKQRLEFPEADDDLLEPAEWIARITKHVGRGVSHDRATFRQEMVIVAALALAAVESFDRRYS